MQVRCFRTMIQAAEDLPRQRRRLSLLASRLDEGQRSQGTIRIMKSKTLVHWSTVSIEGKEPKENPLALASRRSWVLVKIGLRVLPTSFPCPPNARRTSARKRCRW